MLNTLHTPLTQTHYCHCFKDKFCEMRKSITAQVPLRVRTQGTFTHKGRQTVHNSTKVKSKSVLTDFTCRGSHDCLTPAPQRSHHSPHFRHVFRQDRRTLCSRACEAFPAHCPPNLYMLLHCSPEKNVRFGNESECTFLGNRCSQTHRTAQLLWPPVQEMGARGGRGFLISQRTSTESLCNSTLSDLSGVL